MQDHEANLIQATKSLKKEWSFLDPYPITADAVMKRSAVFVCEIKDSGKTTDAYVKIYSYRKHPLQRYLRKGRSQTEARNLLFFHSIGISTPRVLAWGEKRNGIGRIVQEFIITEAVPEAQQLDVFVAEHCPEPKQHEQSQLRMQIAKKLGQLTRAMHKADFIHEDLKWRNVLARRSQDGAEIFWIDCPKGYFSKPGATLDRKKLKDCATLDKVARTHCSKEERQAFLKTYMGKAATGKGLGKLCQEIEDYRRGRFDAKDDCQNKHAKK
jgi:tRNA A-37 threonylcarbamoyl transferase component Bud32